MLRLFGQLAKHAFLKAYPYSTKMLTFFVQNFLKNVTIFKLIKKTFFSTLGLKNSFINLYN